MKHTFTFDGQELTFSAPDNAAESAKRIITDLLSKAGFINIEFDDIKDILDGARDVAIGEGTASGENRCADAARKAIEHIMDADRLIVSVQSSPDVTLAELADAAEMVGESVDPTAQLIWAHVIDESLGDSVKVSVIAASFDMEI
ncbi:MAG: hypothetical protein IJT02_08920 [Synergistaceae bacterium]|nr:hypothetical protein [Synergistaceae bacterium]